MTTISDIARLAGVTPATVSNVLRLRGKVGPETRQRILALVDQLGYRPNLTARALVEGRPHTMALIVSSIANPFYPEFALAVEQAARKRNYFLLVCNTSNDPLQERAYLDAVGGKLAHGVLVMNADFVDLQALRSLWKSGVPVILCMWEKPDQPPALPCVAVDFYQAGVIAAEHLLMLGHQRIGAIIGSEVSGNHIWRYRGFCETLAKAGVEHRPQDVRFGLDLIDAGRNGAYALLAAAPDLTALFVSNDLPAIGVLQAASDLDLNVPTDLSVISITDIEMAHQTRPALTTVAIPIGEAAELAVEMMMRIIAEGGTPESMMSVTSTPRRVMRDTTARARPRAR